MVKSHREPKMGGCFFVIFALFATVVMLGIFYYQLNH